MLLFWNQFWINKIENNFLDASYEYESIDGISILQKAAIILKLRVAKTTTSSNETFKKEYSSPINLYIYLIIQDSYRPA
jgi:hypothetical protein